MESAPPPSAAAGGAPGSARRTFLGMDALKVVFALEYVLQGVANPFQGVTYQPFYKHLRTDYGLDEAATQNLFSRSYLAWSFKPILGFLIDAYGKTRVILSILLAASVFLFVSTPLVDVRASVFFWYMFVLSVFLAATDVAVDRATVVEGDSEARASGKSKSTTVGLNQSICWAAIYGTGILSSLAGGWIADHAPFRWLMIGLGLAPLLVLLAVLRLPRDQGGTIPLRESVLNFWAGINTGPVLWIVVFYFLFHFQPAMGALWNNYLIETLKFTQTQIGVADGVSNAGYFVGVLLFARYGVRWQDRFGLRRVFQVVIVLSILVNLTQYLLVDPWFSRISRALGGFFPFLPQEHVRLGFMSFYNGVLSVFVGFTRMSTFSLVGAVIPSKAAGSLFAGFMSVANLAYSFSYSSGSWLYTHGLEFGFMRAVQEGLFGIPAAPGAEMSISMLILIGSAAYLLSFTAAHMLPDRRQTLATEDAAELGEGPERFEALGPGFLRMVDRGTIAVMACAFVLLRFTWGLDAISAALLSFFGVVFLRKLFLESRYERLPGRPSRP
ncbi:MAG: hypothetical protein HY927_03645 [Elusimicrobia bacterium]|nr:hypothetical protein [Elusimicrobiota bacterium]